MNLQPIDNINQSFTSAGHGQIPLPVMTYLPTAESQSGRNTAAVIGIATGGIFAVFGFLFSIVLLFTVPPAAILTLLFAGAGLAMAAGFGGWLFFKRSEKLQITPGSLIYKSRLQTVELQLYQINRIYPVQKTERRMTKFPIEHYYYISFRSARIETAHSFIEIDLPQPDRISTFDAGKLLRDLLPRLSPSAQIDPGLFTDLKNGAID